MKLLQKRAVSRVIAGMAIVTVAHAIGSAVADEATTEKFDFEQYEAGTEPDDLFVIEGTFKIGDDDGNKVLELEPLPLSESGVIFGKSLKGAAAVTADLKASKRRRSTPRFGIGLHGISGYRLRVVPATSKLELVKSEEVVKSVEYKWTSDEWLTLRLTIDANADGKWVISGWVWPRGGEVPKEPAITMQSEDKPGQGKASIWGTPYSGTPISFDNIVIENREAEESK
ncbi:MAG: hypothetical protein R3F19_26615 [Verrucomicrobiales bacterium]